ncbi:MAG TPA: biopolymer transporter ExbD [Bacteroidales bacterium]|nr:biopolymer transporter ExbD [Bacteroidales bacterium]HOX77787.1 biopolymer transporter ExbD [Bacteroidales bacterium]
MRKQRGIPEINAGSMADIAFLLLIFFLVTVTMDVDTGITRKLPPPVEDDTKVDFNQRNIFEVLVNSANMLLVEGKEGNLATLKDETKNFFLNPTNDINLPEKKLEQIDQIGEVYVSKGVVSLKNDRGTSYEMYIKVQNELTRAFQEMRDELSVEKFGVKFGDLKDPAKQEAVQAVIPIAISEAEPEDVGINK